MCVSQPYRKNSPTMELYWKKLSASEDGKKSPFIADYATSEAKLIISSSLCRLAATATTSLDHTSWSYFRWTRERYNYATEVSQRTVTGPP